MLLKMRSLSFKLTVFYIISVVIVVTGIIAYIEYNNYQRELSDAVRRAEVGPGFINGATPDNSPFLTAVTNNSVYSLKASDIKNHLERFKPFIDETVASRWSYSMDGPITIENQDYYNITFKIVNKQSDVGAVTILSGQSDYSFEVGPVTIPKSFFPVTIASFLSYTNNRTNELYYLPISGFENSIYVVSLDRYSFPDENWRQLVTSDLIGGLPLILIVAVIFGLLISWLTTAPLKRITRATELLSHSDLNQRVKYKSNDEIGRLAVSFNTMADRLEESFNSQKRFISDAAHELRTPLASMKTSVTKALSMESDSSDDRAPLGFLSGRIDYMEILVNDLLFLSRVDEGQFKPNKAVLDLSKLLAEAEESFRCLFEDKNINFTSEITADLDVKADRTLILRVISNLLDNAAKNTPSGGSVSLTAFKQNNEVTITVSDTGAGIPPEHLPHIFERFYKVPGLTRSNNGYGLGLAISKSIINSIGGEISVQSEPGKGSTFTIKLPQSNLQSY